MKISELLRKAVDALNTANNHLSEARLARQARTSYRDDALTFLNEAITSIANATRAVTDAGYEIEVEEDEGGA